MKLTDKLSAELPFSGLYNSMYSHALDDEEEQFCEYEAEYRQEEDGIPEELHLDAGEYAEILMDVTTYDIAHQAIAKKHVEVFEGVASKELGFKLPLVFEEMCSPKFYNFTTDRVFASITYGQVLRLFALSKKDKHARLEEMIKTRFTSYDGFISSYSNRLDKWLAKPLADWDHNEVGTLLRAVLGDVREEVESIMYDGETFYTAWSDSVDWAKFEEKVTELREEKGKSDETDTRA